MPDGVAGWDKAMSGGENVWWGGFCESVWMGVSKRGCRRCWRSAVSLPSALIGVGCRFSGSLSLICITVINIILWGKKGFISVKSLKSIMKGSQDRNSRRKPRCRNWLRDREDDCWLFQLAYSQLPQLRIICPRITPPIGAWAFSQLSLIRKMLHGHAHWAIW